MKNQDAHLVLLFACLFLNFNLQASQSDDAAVISSSSCESIGINDKRKLVRITERVNCGQSSALAQDSTYKKKLKNVISALSQSTYQEQKMRMKSMPMRLQGDINDNDCILRYRYYPLHYDQLAIRNECVRVVVKDIDELRLWSSCYLNEHINYSDICQKIVAFQLLKQRVIMSNNFMQSELYHQQIEFFCNNEIHFLANDLFFSSWKKYDSIVGTLHPKVKILYRDAQELYADIVNQDTSKRSVEVQCIGLQYRLSQAEYLGEHKDILEFYAEMLSGNVAMYKQKNTSRSGRLQNYIEEEHHQSLDAQTRKLFNDIANLEQDALCNDDLTLEDINDLTHRYELKFNQLKNKISPTGQRYVEKSLKSLRSSYRLM